MRIPRIRRRPAPGRFRHRHVVGETDPQRIKDLTDRIAAAELDRRNDLVDRRFQKEAR